MIILLTVLSGFTVLLTIIMLGNINKRIGLMPTTFINFLTGTIGALIILLINNQLDFQILKGIPPYLFLSSFFVIGITMLNGTIINKIPAIYTTMLIFIGQLAAGIIIDYFRYKTFSIGDLIGGFIILLGLGYNSFSNRALPSTLSDSNRE